MHQIYRGPSVRLMAAHIETVNPATGRTIGSVPDMDGAQVRQAVQRASRVAEVI